MLFIEQSILFILASKSLAHIYLHHNQQYKMIHFNIEDAIFLSLEKHLQKMFVN